MAKANRRPKNKKLKAKQRKESGRQKELSLQNEEAIIKRLTQALQVHMQGNHTQAQAMCNQILDLYPNQSDALDLLGIISNKLGKFEDAIKYHQKAIKSNPEKGFYYSNLGASLKKLERAEEALEAYEKALEIGPKSEQVYFNMAIALRSLGRLDDAIQCYEKVLEINPDHTSANYNLGNALGDAGETERALAHQEKAQTTDPQHAKAKYNKSLLNLRLGQLKEGFRDYEYRWMQGDAHHFPKGLENTPTWDGTNLNGGTLLIYGEQGLGDILQFIRYAKIVKEEKGVGKICVRCHQPLYSLLESIDEIDELVEPDTLPEFDAFIPIMSLPYIMGTELDTIPSETPYIYANKDRVAKWADKVSQGTLKIGIVWAGNAGHKNDHNRSCPLALFESLMDLPQTVFYSIQKGREEEEIAQAMTRHSSLINLAPEITDFADTAAIMEHLDLTISVDTSPVHLAGAMNKEVWTLLPFVPDWRWMADREDCPWYPSMKLFRQPEIGDWPDVFKKVKEHLVEILRGKGLKIKIQDPDSPPQRLKRALELKNKGQAEEAEHICRDIIKTAPETADAYGVLGIICHDQERYSEAVENHEKSIEINDKKGDYHTNLGAALEKIGKFEEAIESHNRAISLDPSDYKYYYNLSMALLGADKIEESIGVLRKAVELNPKHLNSIFSLANHLNKLGEFDEALELFEKAHDLDPSDMRIPFNRSFIELLKGDLENGFKDYEARFEQGDDILYMPDFVKDKPLWDGTDLKDKTILIHAEQGFGDIIQFIRYTPKLKKMGARVIVEAHGPLQDFLQQSEDVDVLLKDGELIPEFDFHAPVLSLPYHFKTTLETIPNKTPYLKPSAEKTKKWKEYFDKDGLKVGFVWAGREAHQNDHNRSCKLEDFLTLIDNENITFYSLQKGRDEEAAAECASKRQNVIDLGSKIEDFSDSAAIINQLDLIISVDTAVVHMAGALNKPVWTLLPFVPDWRWMLDREYSPWYPSMRLFRQKARKQWDEVFAKVKEELEKIVEDPESLQLSEQVEIDSEPQETIEIKNHEPDQSISPEAEATILLQQAVGELQSKNFAKVEEICNQVIASSPNRSDAQNMISIALQKQGRIDEAIEHMKKAVEIEPNNESFQNNLGLMYKTNENDQASIEHFSKAIEINPNNAHYHFNLCYAFFKIEKYKEAKTSSLKTLKIDPNHYDAIIMAANMSQKLREVPEAIEFYDRALAIKPDDDRNIYNRSLAHLLLGNLEEGFKQYDKRWGHIQDLELPDMAREKPFWNGENISGKTIFLHTEQGFGDAIQFIRFLPEVKNHTDNIIVGCKRETIDLFRPILPDAIWVAEGSKVPDFDIHLPVMSLPHILKTTLDTIPQKIPYINAEEEKIKKWKPQINPDTINVGIVWSGNPRFPDNKNRSCPLDQLESLMDIPGVTFYSLQKGSQEKELAELMSRRDNVKDMGNQVESFTDTAAILSQLDLFIATDTSVPHLAGAMGVKTYLLASYVPDWRWLLDREDSPWYPTLKLFRQPTPQDWATPLDKIKTKLEDLVNENGK